MIDWIFAAMLVAEHAKPVEVPGFLLLHICDLNPKNYTVFPEWVYLSPHAIMGVSRPPNIPKGCVAINTINGKRLFFHGTEYEIMLQLVQAIREQRDLK